MKLFETMLDGTKVRLTAYLHEDETVRPTMLVCPGGGYTAHAAHEGEPVAMHWYALGYQVFILYYTIGETDSVSLALREIARTMAHIRANAGEWHVDAEKIAVIGFSAGAHLCANLSVHAHDTAFLAETGLESEQIAPNTCLLIYPALDMRLLMEHAREDRRPTWKRVMLGVENDGVPTDEDYLRASPNLHVTENVAPTFLSHSYSDQTVSVLHSVNYAQRLAECGVPFEMHISEDGWHGYAMCLYHGTDRPGRDACAQWIPAAERWLRKRFGM